MSEISTNLTLPFIQPSQAQKHITHNEAIEILDVIVQLCVQGFDVHTPPAAPAEGQSWQIGTAPTGDWAAQAGMIANWAGGGWIYLAPQIGWRAIDAVTGEMRVYSGTIWAGLTPRSHPRKALSGARSFWRPDATQKARHSASSA